MTTEETNKQADDIVDISSLKNVAFYLEGLKQGKGNILPLGTIDLENLWNTIKVLQKFKKEQDLTSNK